MSSVEVAVRGGGVIGLSVALAAARAGFSVSVFDDGSPHAGSRVAGGMLAPLTEAWPGEEAVVAQGVAALALWPSFAASIGVPLFTAGTLAVGTQPGDLADLRHAGELLTSREIRALEPSLGPAVRGGVYASGDLAVDNRVLLSALWKACREAGVVSSVDGRVTVIAAGAWSGELHPALKGVIRPVKGEILRLTHRSGALPPPRHTIRALVSGRPVYLVPRDDGLVVGATQYEAGFDTDVSVAGVRDLLGTRKPCCRASPSTSWPRPPRVPRGDSGQRPDRRPAGARCHRGDRPRSLRLAAGPVHRTARGRSAPGREFVKAQVNGAPATWQRARRGRGRTLVGAPDKGVAVAVDGAVVPRSEWDRTIVPTAARSRW